MIGPGTQADQNDPLNTTHCLQPVQGRSNVSEIGLEERLFGRVRRAIPKAGEVEPQNRDAGPRKLP